MFKYIAKIVTLQCSWCAYMQSCCKAVMNDRAVPITLLSVPGKVDDDGGGELVIKLHSQHNYIPLSPYFSKVYKYRLCATVLCTIISSSYRSVDCMRH